MRIDVVTIFPDYLAPLELSLIGRAQAEGRLEVVVHDLRDFTEDRHRSVDDTPYGGGAGMVMSPEPWGAVLDSLLADHPTGPADQPTQVVVLTPSGAPFTQAVAAQLAGAARLVLLCGRYEGIDHRVSQHAATRAQVHELSIGDYVLAGGEAAALVVVEAVTRLVPGVLGNADSLTEESHVDGVLEYPVFTKPPTWRGLDVPEVLLSGDHGRIARWRRTQSLTRTAAVRPDLLQALDPATVSDGDRALLANLGWTVGADGRFRREPPAVAH